LLRAALVDWEMVERRLQEIAGEAGAPGCVLLCFEDVLVGEHCHRRLVAEHWGARTGVVVPELEPATQQLTLSP
jgi:hypothetical protein